MIARRERCLSCLTVFLLPAAAAGQETPDARAILKRADAATKAVKAVSYRAEFHGEGDPAGRWPRIRGTVIGRQRPRGPLSQLFGSEGGPANRYENLRHFLRIRGEILSPDEGEGERFDITLTPKQVISIDHRRKVWSYTGFRSGQELVALGRPLFLIEYLHPGPFRDEIAARVARQEGVKDVGGVACDVIYVVYRNGTEARWFFGREDALPRRVERIAAGGFRNGKTVLSLYDVNVDPEIDRDTFHPSRPKDYTKRPVRQSDRPKLLPVGSAAPNWKLRTADGRTVSLKGLRGNVVVMDFWATWCSFCKLSMKDVQALHESFKDRPVRVFGVNCWEDGDPAAYMKSKGYTYPTLLKADRVAEDYRLPGLPTFYVIDPEGRVAYARCGLKRKQELARVIEELLEKAEEGK